MSGSEHPPGRPGARAVRACLAAALVLVVVGVFAPPDLVPRRLMGDKIQHVLAFAVLTAVPVTLRPSFAFVVIPALVAIGGVVELLQVFTDRNPDWGDMAANVAGIGLGLAAGLAGYAILRLLRGLRR